MKTLHGGFLLIVRWCIIYPVIFILYRVRNWTRSPFLLNPKLAEDPGILVANYNNYFFDALLGLMLTPVWPYSLLSDCVMRNRLSQLFFKFFRVFAFARKHETDIKSNEQQAFNQNTINQLATRLKEKSWAVFFPEAAEGKLVVSPCLAPILKPGVAKLALKAEAEAGFELNLKIYVYGVNYENQIACGSNVFIRWARPIEVKMFQAVYLQDPGLAEQQLTDLIQKSLQEVVLEATSFAELALIHQLAMQLGEYNWSNIQKAAELVKDQKVGITGLAPAMYERSFLKLGLVLSYPFRLFGKLAATSIERQMFYQVSLWLLILFFGAWFNGLSWILAFALTTIIGARIWLWAWRKGKILVNS